jgi:hypothetical protein
MPRRELAVVLIGEVIFVNRGVDGIVEANAGPGEAIIVRW